MEIKKYLEEKKQKIDNALEVLLAPLKEHSVLYAAMSYGLLSPGKRIRPILMLSTYNASANSEDEIIPFACSVEMIHAYSLIHDDLPIMDNSDLRRGRPTCHKIYGSDMALLAGDALLSYAFEIISNPKVIKSFKQEAVASVLHEYAFASGVKGLVGGQVMDVVTTSDEAIDEETILYIEKKKTAALITLSIRAAAILAHLEDSEITALSRFGEYLGISYQIVDDVLDYSSKPEVLGKDIGQNVKNKKASFVSLYGIEKAKEIAKEYSFKGIDFIMPYGNKYETLKELALYLLERNK